MGRLAGVNKKPKKKIIIIIISARAIQASLKLSV